MHVNARGGVRSIARPVAGALLQVAGGGLVLVVLVGRLGSKPFQAGLQAVSVPAVLATCGLMALATLAAAWRWRVVASALGMQVSLSAAVGAYYRSQLLNSVLPGGVLGDGHRAVAHGHRVGGVARAVRAVVWERMAGQVVQAGMTAVALLVLPSPVRPVASYVFVGASAAVLVGVAVRGCRAVGGRRHAPSVRRGRLARLTQAVSSELRYRVLAPKVWPQLLITSVVVVAAHTTMLLMAARLVDVHASTGGLVGLLLLIQTATAIPLSVGGWGPREGMAAWAFAAAGMGVATGVSVTTLYAVLALMALAPGAFFLLRDAIQRLDHRHPVGRRLVAPDG